MEERRKPYGVLRMVILAIVLSKGRVHGYEICKTIESFAYGAWRPSQGTIYRVLNEMVEEGLLDKEVIEDRRQVAYYTITEQGIRAFLEIAQEFFKKLNIVLPLTVEAVLKVNEYGYHTDEILARFLDLAKSIAKLYEYVGERKKLIGPYHG